MSNPSVLIVDDDPQLAAMLADYLQQQGFSVETEQRGDRAAARVLAAQPDLLVLDLMLPGKDGLAVCREVRDAYRGRILMLTARGSEVDEIVGLEIGADDYLAKPVRPHVLLARVRALLRRSTAEAGGHALRLGDLTIDPPLREVRVRGDRIELTSGEFDLLLLLGAHAGQVVSRQTMYRRLRGTEPGDFGRSIDLMVSRLRQKLREASGNQDVIKTVRGVGYIYAVA
jgi:two-component system response regulator RstA